MEHCLQMCEDYEQMLSATIDTSEISKINNAGGEPVTVSDETAGLIEEGIRYGDISGGRFDITVAPATELWNFTDNEEKTLPIPMNWQRQSNILIIIASMWMATQ